MKRLFRSDKKKTDVKFVESKEEDCVAPNITWQHSWSFDETRDALSESFFATIPNEIILRIFRLFSVRDLCNVSLVCRWFKVISDQDEIWKWKCNTSIKLYSKSFKHIYMDWMHEKYLRNIKLQKKRAHLATTACIRCLPPIYPVRPTDKHHFESIGGFIQHPNSLSDMIITLSVDINKTARELIELLEKASKFQQRWQESSILKQMITRYYRFMQLKASHPTNILLVPTLDIEMVWQTHLLRPEIYQADCLRLFRRAIDHSLLTSDIQQFFKKQAFIDTYHLYEQRFSEQYCSLPLIDEKKETTSIYSYWDKTYFEFSSESSKDYENPFSFTEGDILIDGNWLDLCKQFMSDAIDIIWHSHMQEPLNYASDCIRLVDYIIYHAPWPMIDNETMKKTRDKTDQIWKQEFETDITTDHLYNTIDNRVDWY